MMASGSVGTFASRITLPSASTTHRLVSATETSKPAYSSKAALLFASVKPKGGSWFTNPKGPPLRQHEAPRSAPIPHLANIGARARERSILLLTFRCDWSEAGVRGARSPRHRSPTDPVSVGCTLAEQPCETPNYVSLG